jgi:hypothetical protein
VSTKGTLRLWCAWPFVVHYYQDCHDHCRYVEVRVEPRWPSGRIVFSRGFTVKIAQGYTAR